MARPVHEQPREMDGAPSNPYEEQLYRVFKTFDVGDEGALDRAAVLQLCDALQLEARGAALVDELFRRRPERVTFAHFRSGLLSVLGEPSAPPAQTTPPAPDHSDDDSSGREVAPKFVFGAKRYGRRSRPQRAAADGAARPRGSSESRLDSARAAPRERSKRSASAMESRDEAPALDHDRPVDRECALQLCRGLRMGGVDMDLVDRVFDAGSADEISVGEFFDRLNTSLSSSLAASLDGVGAAGDALSSDAVAEAWERAGVARPRRLLAELGFAHAALRPPELERALDDELRALGPPAPPPDARALLLQAAAALARLRLDAAARQLDAARAERDKLRDDLAEANRRARLLAQDVDDNHARLEAELQAGLRQVEARHADAARAAAADAAAERERAAAARRQLDEETARRVDAEARLRAETAALRDQIHELQEQAKVLEGCAAAAEREAARAAQEATAATRREAAAAAEARAEAAAAAALAGELRADNQRLRDRVDELGAALEVGARRGDAVCARAPCWREEAALHAAPLHDETPESSPIKNQRMLNLNQTVVKLQAVFDSEKLPERREDDCPNCVNIRDTIATLREAVQESRTEMKVPRAPTCDASARADASSQTALSEGEEAAALRGELRAARERHEADRQDMAAVIQELERGAASLRAELASAEEYWAAKLDDERELYAEEQRAGDERLAELVSKISEYERQFARPALPAIDESAALERQYTELELEFRAYRTHQEAQLAARAEEVEQLQRELREAERREAELREVERRGAERRALPSVQPRPDAPACACGAPADAWARWRAAWSAREAAALRARAARAERAAQRLHARLAAADLLVKDLYIENCRLAHAPHHPRLP